MGPCLRLFSIIAAFVVDFVNGEQCAETTIADSIASSFSSVFVQTKQTIKAHTMDVKEEIDNDDENITQFDSMEKDMIKAMFAGADLDNDGELIATELKESGMPKPDDPWEKIVGIYDKDGSGSLNIEEFSTSQHPETVSDSLQSLIEVADEASMLDSMKDPDIVIDDAAAVGECFDTDDEALREEAENKLMYDMATGAICMALDIASGATEGIPVIGGLFGVAAAVADRGAEMGSDAMEYGHTIAGLNRDNCAKKAAVATLQLIEKTSEEIKQELKAGNKMTQDLVRSETRASARKVLKGQLTIVRQLETQQIEHQNNHQALYNKLDSISDQVGMLALKLDQLSMKVDEVLESVDKGSYDSMVVQFLDAVSLLGRSYDELVNSAARLKYHDAGVMYIKADEVEIQDWLEDHKAVNRGVEASIVRSWSGARAALESLVNLGRGDFYHKHYTMLLLTTIRSYAQSRQCTEILSELRGADGLMVHFQNALNSDELWGVMTTGIFNAIQLYDVMVLIFPASYQTETKAVAESIHRLHQSFTQVKNRFTDEAVSAFEVAKLLSTVLPTLCPIRPACKRAAVRAGLPHTQRMLDLGEGTFALGIHDFATSIKRCHYPNIGSGIEYKTDQELVRHNEAPIPDPVPCGIVPATLQVECPRDYRPRWSQPVNNYTNSSKATYKVECKRSKQGVAYNTYGVDQLWQRYYTVQFGAVNLFYCLVPTNSLCPSECTGGCFSDAHYFWGCSPLGEGTVVEDHHSSLTFDLNVPILPITAEWVTRVDDFGAGQKLLMIAFDYMHLRGSRRCETVNYLANWRVSLWLTIHHTSKKLATVLQIPHVSLVVLPNTYKLLLKLWSPEGVVKYFGSGAVSKDYATKVVLTGKDNVVCVKVGAEHKICSSIKDNRGSGGFCAGYHAATLNEVRLAML